MAALSTRIRAHPLFQFAGAGLGSSSPTYSSCACCRCCSTNNRGYLGSLRSGGRISPALSFGGGSQPIHVLIVFSRSASDSRSEEASRRRGESKKTKALAKVGLLKGLISEKRRKPPEWVEIVTRARRSPTARQSAPAFRKPNLVVYHHTACPASRVSRTWSTVPGDEEMAHGYHCVVMPDGAIKPFCRWDPPEPCEGAQRPQPGDFLHGQFSHRGGDNFPTPMAFGNQRPTEAQLHAGARVVALLGPSVTRHQAGPHTAARSHAGHTSVPDPISVRPVRTLVRQYHDAWSTPRCEQGREQFKQLNSSTPEGWERSTSWRCSTDRCTARARDVSRDRHRTLSRCPRRRRLPEARGGPAEIEKWKKRGRLARIAFEVRPEQCRFRNVATVLPIVCRNWPGIARNRGLIAVSVEQVRTMSTAAIQAARGSIGDPVRFFFKLDIFALVMRTSNPASTAAVVFVPMAGDIVSGVAMGLGDGPVHN